MRVDGLKKRHFRLRKKVSGTPEKPRLMVRKTLTNTYAMLIDDLEGKTLASASSLKINGGSKTEKEVKVGEMIAELGIKNDISTVVFDTGGNKYHGRVSALADAAREKGLKF
jgi:large subunit ribosomal protein L18